MLISATNAIAATAAAISAANAAAAAAAAAAADTNSTGNNNNSNGSNKSVDSNSNNNANSDIIDITDSKTVATNVLTGGAGAVASSGTGAGEKDSYSSVSGNVPVAHLVSPLNINDPRHWSKHDRYDTDTLLENAYKKHLSRHANK